MAASVSVQAASVSTLPGNLLSRTFCNSILLPALSTSMPTRMAGEGVRPHALHPEGEPLGERLRGELQRQAPRRAARP